MSHGSVQPKMYLNEKGCYLTMYSCLKKKERLAWYKLITCFKVCGKVHFRFDLSPLLNIHMIKSSKLANQLIRSEMSCK